MRLAVFVWFVLANILLVGCATTKSPEIDRKAVKAEQALQLELSFDNLLKYQRRLDPIARPILVNATDFCGARVTRDIGAYVANKYAVAHEYRRMAAKRGIGRQPQVLWLIEGGPAEAAGMHVGDKIIAVSGNKIEAGSDAMEEYRKALRKRITNSDALQLTVLRGSQEVILSVPSVLACDYPVMTILDLVPNAYADGSIIAINSGMMRFFERPQDLQVVIGHELAHNVEGHIGKGITGSVLGMALDIVLGADGWLDEIVPTAFSPGLEAEADYVGLYIAANAGVDISEAERVWREFGAESSGDHTQGMLDTHPASPNRFVALRATVQEIEKKRANGESLRPNR